MDNVLGVVNSLEMNELHRAVQENRSEGVQFLIANGAEIANTIDDGQTPLHLACNLNLHHITEELLKNKSRDELRNVVDARIVSTGEAALHLAVRNSSLENARLLLSRGAQYDILNKNSQAPQSLVSDKSMVELISCVERVFNSTSTGDNQAILDALNSCAPENLSAVAYARNSKDQTALQAAMEKSHLQALGVIVDFRTGKLKQNPWQAGAKIDKLMQHSKAARLHSSRLDSHCYGNAHSIIVDLLSEARDFLEAYKEHGGSTLTDQPLLAVIEETLEFFGSSDDSEFIENENVKRLLWKGVAFSASMLKLCITAPVRLLMRRVYTLELLEAARKNDLRLVEKCLTGNPDLNEADANNRTALRYAFENKNDEMVKRLLRLGVDPSNEGVRREEPFLHFALRRMKEWKCHVDLKIVELMFDRLSGDKLIDFVNARVADDGTSALHWAAAQSDFRLVQVLMNRGAIYCAKNARNEEPKTYTDNSDVKRLLEFADRSFDQARNGQVKDMAHAMRKVSVTTRLAVFGTRDEQGQSLDRVAELAGHVDAAEQIRQMMASERADYCKRLEFFRY